MFFRESMFLLALLPFIATLSKAESSPAPSNSLVWPSELYTSLIPQNLCPTHTFAVSPDTVRTIGKWKWFSPDLWTTGFFASDVV